MSRRLFDQSELSNHMSRAETERQARTMLDAFNSVGVEQFAVLLTDIKKKDRASGEDRSYAWLRKHIDGTLAYARSEELNIILRPLDCPVPLIQLDDLGMVRLQGFFATAFLAVCTSPGSFQGWFAVEDADEDFGRRLRIGSSADLDANGSVRLSGSRNIRREYAPRFPYVHNVFVGPGCIVKRAELEALGVVAPPSRS